MAYYLIEGTYTPEAWAAQVESPESVADRMTRNLEACGGKLVCVYYALGDVDLVAIVEFQEPEDAAAYSLTVLSSGQAGVHRLTALLSVDQGMASMRRARDFRESFLGALGH